MFKATRRKNEISSASKIIGRDHFMRRVRSVACDEHCEALSARMCAPISYVVYFCLEFIFHRWKIGWVWSRNESISVEAYMQLALRLPRPTFYVHSDVLDAIAQRTNCAKPTKRALSLGGCIDDVQRERVRAYRN